MVYAASILTYLDCLLLKFWMLFNVLPNPIMSSPSVKFSTAADLFEISIWYCFPTSSSFSFLVLNLSPSKFCAACLLTANLSLTFAITRQWSDHSWRTSCVIECHLLSINMWSVWLWVFPSGGVQVHLWTFRCGDIVLLTTRFFMRQFTILTLLSWLSWGKFSFPVVGLKISSLSSFSVKSANIFFIRLKKNETQTWRWYNA